MGIVSYRRAPGYPKTQKTLNGKKVTVTTQDRLYVLTNDENFFGEDIDLALPWSIGAYFGSARLKDRRIDRSNKKRLLWFVDDSYTTDYSDEDDQDKDQPPDLRRPKWSWDFETMDLLVTRDMETEDPIANSVGEPIELTDDFMIPVLTVERWEPFFDPDTILNYGNRTNENPFWGAPANTALMAGIRDRPDEGESFNGFTYRKVSYVIKFKLPILPDLVEGWKEILMDRGTFYLEAGDTVRPFMAGSARKTGKLDGSGGKLADGDPPHWLKFNKKKKANFDSLNINWPL